LNFQLTLLSPDTIQVSDGARSRIAYGVLDGPRTWVFLDGRTFVVGDAGAAAGPAAALDEARTTLAAPMPATVMDVKVAPGDQVARGDVLITLEAMKMELPIRAPRDARVPSVGCRAGDLVQPGVPLLELE
jgi:biotin carboxyl carrier protein